MTDTREIETQIVRREGHVVLLFSRRENGELVRAETDNLNLTPTAALVAAEMLSAMAFEADTSLKPVGETLKASLVERHRDKLIPRVALMLANLREDKTASNGEIAVKIMDVVCSEVFS